MSDAYPADHPAASLPNPQPPPLQPVTLDPSAHTGYSPQPAPPNDASLTSFQPPAAPQVGVTPQSSGFDFTPSFSAPASASPQPDVVQPSEPFVGVPPPVARDFTDSTENNHFQQPPPLPAAPLPAPSVPLTAPIPTSLDIVFDSSSSTMPPPLPTNDSPSLKRDSMEFNHSGDFPNSWAGTVGNGTENGVDHEEHVAKRAKVDTPPDAPPNSYAPVAQYHAPYPHAPLYPPHQPVSHQPPQTYDSLPLSSAQKKHFLSTVRSLKKLKEAYAFLMPVDPIALNVPTYYQIITHPMDLSTIEHKLLASGPKPKGKADKGKYMVKDEVIRDFRYVWENSARFNGEGHAVTQAGRAVEIQFDLALQKLPADEPLVKTPTPSPAARLPHPLNPAGPSHSQNLPHGLVNGASSMRRTSTDGRPKREIHPTNKDLESSIKKRPGKKEDPQMKYLLKHVDELMSKKAYSSWAAPFHYPVDTVALNIPEYNEIVKRPMDLNTIRTNLLERFYDEPADVNADVKLMIKNCFLFNPPLSPVHNSGLAFQQHWQDAIWSRLPPKEESSPEPEHGAHMDLEPEQDSDDETDAALAAIDAEIVALQAKRDLLTRKQNKKSKSKKAGGASKPSKPKTAPKAPKPSTSKPAKKAAAPNGPPAPPPAPKPKKAAKKVRVEESEDENVVTVTQQQKQELAEKIIKTEGETLNKAITIIQESMPLGEASEEIELDIESLPAATVLKLYNLVVRKAKRKGTGKGNKGGTGGLNRKTTNEDAESERIRALEEKIKQFEEPIPNTPHGDHAAGSDSGSESGSSGSSDSDSE